MADASSSLFASLPLFFSYPVVLLPPSLTCTMSIILCRVGSPSFAISILSHSLKVNTRPPPKMAFCCLQGAGSEAVKRGIARFINELRNDSIGLRGRCKTLEEEKK